LLERGYDMSRGTDPQGWPPGREAPQEDWRERAARLQQELEDLNAERRLLEVELRRKTTDLEHARDEVLRLSAEMEGHVRERTAELEEACRDMRKLDELKDNFLSSVSHELRTPLTSIRSFSEILLQYDDVDPENRTEFLQIINTESERLTRLVNDFLDLSKIESGNMVWYDDLMSLEQVVRDTVRIQEPLAGKQSLTLRVEFPDDLPLVFSDRDRIQQVVTNLLGNAVKFSPPGGEIRIHGEKVWSRGLEDGTECIRVSVSDQGRGVSVEDRERIFDRFRQATDDTMKNKPEGTGLGLPISREIVSHYKGEMGLWSEVGKGSTFWFTLPVSPVSAGDPVRARPQDLLQGSKGKTILVVDDNRNVRRVLRYQFQKRGYAVLEAACGQEAIELTRAARVDLITLDLMMPTMSGYDVLRMIRDNPVTRDVPILVISVVEDKEQGLLLGANDVLGKPFVEQDLLGKVRSLMGEERRSILVVDDEASVREILTMRLQEMGLSADGVPDGEAAIAYMKDRVPDLLILDVFLPGKSGYEVLSWVRKDPRTCSLPVIMISSCPFSDHGISLLRLGADAIVEKSEGLDSLFERIDGLVMPRPAGAGAGRSVSA